MGCPAALPLLDSCLRRNDGWVVARVGCVKMGWQSSRDKIELA